MPSPIAHSVTGYALAHIPFIKARTFPSRLWPMTPLATLYALFITNLPDLDFVPQIVTGLRFHRGPSHSLLSALIVSSLLAGIVHYYRKSRAKPGRLLNYKSLFTLTFGLYSSHLLLDLFTRGGNGIPLLWPITDQRVQLPFAIFPSVHHSLGLWNASHIVFISAELIYSACLLTSLWLIKSNAQPNATQRSSDSQPDSQPDS